MERLTTKEVAYQLKIKPNELRVLAKLLKIGREIYRTWYFTKKDVEKLRRIL